jgi:hypothetical protein
MVNMNKRLLPTGICWCGCGGETGIGSFFLQGHDKRAEAYVHAVEYGSVAGFLAAHGYGTEPGQKNAKAEYERWKEQSRRSP